MSNKKKKPRVGAASGKPTNAIPAHNYTGKLSLIIPLYNEVERFPRMVKTLRKFEQYWKVAYEVLLVNDGSSDNTLELLQEEFGTPASEEQLVTYRVINQEKNAGKGHALKRGIAEAEGDHLLTLDADMACSPMTLLSWLKQLPEQTFEDETIYIGSREHEESVLEANAKRRVLGRLFNGWVQLLTGSNSYDTQCGFKLYPKALGKWLFGQMAVKGWAHDVELLHHAGLYNVPVVEMPVKWQEVDDSKVSVWFDGIKMGMSAFLLVWANMFRFFFVQPFKEQKLGLALNSTKEAPIYRFLFGVLAVVLLFLMPYLSFDYGITADEEVQRIYGGHVLDYFESDAVDGEALTFQNLYLYGGLFDYCMAWLHKYIFPEWDIYEMRHLFNALLGAFLLIFTGLLAKSVSQRWQVAFWTLVFMTLSPRIFGHSMNNPKDIPFAFSYVFTLYFLMNFVRQLPRPSFQSIAGLIVGISISINIRVGGILLIPYLFLFTGGAYVVESRLRPLLSNFLGLFRLGLLLLVIAVLGYLGGSLFWPFAQEDPIGGPRLALAEMSNFTTGIRMVWGGQHYWSDFLPWNYIIKWFSIATPALILVGSVAAIYPILKDEKNRWLFLMVIFTGVFPVAYAIYQDSALYDGMRHFLFVYPILAVMAAYGLQYAVVQAQNKMVTLGVAVVLLLGLYSPIRWMIVSHPNQYMYFNEFFGGIAPAYNDYETDYWMNSTKEAANWAIENLPEIKAGQPVKIATQAHKPVRHYFAPYENVQAVYTRYHERIKHDWDYGLYITRFVNRDFIENGLFPPGEELIASREIDGTLIWAITKRSETNKAAHEADEAFKNKENDKALGLLQAAVADNPKDESAWLLLAQYHLQLGQMPEAKTALDTLIGYSPSYSNSLGLMGMYYLNMKKIPEAEEYLRRATESNIKYVFGHYNLARIYASQGKMQEALERLELFDRYGSRPIQGYDLAIQIATSMQNDAVKSYFTAKKFTLSGNWNAALPELNRTLAILPDYAPALRLKSDYDKAVANQRRQMAREARLRKAGKIK
jgi:glycosyltransferase involved in cell wall biosynthesis